MKLFAIIPDKPFAECKSRLKEIQSDAARLNQGANTRLISA
jgi:hypothetical protein